jgi:hypothetical protein
MLSLRTHGRVVEAESGVGVPALVVAVPALEGGTTPGVRPASSRSPRSTPPSRRLRSTRKPPLSCRSSTPTSGFLCTGARRPLRRMAERDDGLELRVDRGELGAKAPMRAVVLLSEDRERREDFDGGEDGRRLRAYFDQPRSDGGELALGWAPASRPVHPTGSRPGAARARPGPLPPGAGLQPD